MNRIGELERRLREAEERAKKEQQRAEEAEREGQKEQDRAEKEQKLAEKEQQRAEDADRERQKEKQRAEEAETQTRPTTFDEYISACHGHVFCQFRVERDRTLTSRGAFLILCGCVPLDNRVFESRNFLTGLGRRVTQRSIADEKTLEYFMHNSVEDPARAIMDQLSQISDVRDAFDVGNGIVFENHPHAISDIAEETYHYMIEGGLGYGLLTTGEAAVFLNVDWAKPETLSAVVQHVAFSLMALGRPGQRVEHAQDEGDRAMGDLRRDAVEAEETVSTRRSRRDEISRSHRTTGLDISLLIHRARLSDTNEKDEAIPVYPDEVNGS
ncbi:hypothetical protein RJ55_01254 [Drechmeria coniospora]|nr:hypothetical protein RJ55_01254 [Drechmeria coniospora]